MSFRNAFGIYHVLKQHLETATKPLTCVDLFDHADVREFASDSNRVSDYLGHMYRRGLLSRYPAPRTDSSAARFAYLWKANKKIEAPRQRFPQPKLELAANETKPLRSNLRVVEHPDGSLTIEFQSLLITVKPK